MVQADDSPIQMNREWIKSKKIDTSNIQNTIRGNFGTRVTVVACTKDGKMETFIDETELGMGLRATKKIDMRLRIEP